MACWMFQFLGRNSGRSDDPLAGLGTGWNIPFQFLGRNSGRSDAGPRRGGVWSGQSFNSSVGILVVRTENEGLVPCPMYAVSIPRSEFWSFGLPCSWASSSDRISFQFLGRNSGRSDLQNCPPSPINQDSFNSSVGILVVRTRSRPTLHVVPGRFQFLGRNSGRSDFAHNKVAG